MWGSEKSVSSNDLVWLFWGKERSYPCDGDSLSLRRLQFTLQMPLANCPHRQEQMYLYLCQIWNSAGSNCCPKDTSEHTDGVTSWHYVVKLKVPKQW
jgi:hypothetical protein